MNKNLELNNSFMTGKEVFSWDITCINMFIMERLYILGKLIVIWTLESININ